MLDEQVVRGAVEVRAGARERGHDDAIVQRDGTELHRIIQCCHDTLGYTYATEFVIVRRRQANGLLTTKKRD